MPSNSPNSSLLLHRINSTAACHKQRRTPLTCATPVPDSVVRYHTHAVGPTQCCSAAVQQIAAPVAAVWPLVRRFDNPQAYKHFVKSCHVIDGDGRVGTVREIHVISGLPAASSTERLEILDDERHVIGFSMVGGDHRLANYRSVTTLHPTPTGAGQLLSSPTSLTHRPVTLWKRPACSWTRSYGAISNRSLRSPRTTPDETNTHK
ncbi:PYR1-like 4 [Actinidia rufa]|uniref:PYR1-like 4 n=1 Tax=Actinidia rufa TaxID=165716 RepID=A0A7J0EBD5_9ERIC|nr:PYR1-like 4 [Actinidia rufa]